MTARQWEPGPAPVEEGVSAPGRPETPSSTQHQTAEFRGRDPKKNEITITEQNSSPSKKNKPEN